jgi:molybdenum cofactor cytidylyltransferase
VSYCLCGILPVRRMKEKYSAIILSAGNSERMGSPKALLLWKNDMTFLEKIANEFHRSGCKEIIIVTNTEVANQIKTKQFKDNVTTAINFQPERGRFSSVKIGLSEISDPDFCFIHNVDNPFIDDEIIRKMYSERNNEFYIVPSFLGKGGHPILLNKKNIEFLKAVEDTGQSLKEALSGFEKRQIEMPDDRVLRNINTEDDFKRYCAM